MSVKIYIFALIVGSMCLVAASKSVAGVENLSEWSNPSPLTLPSEGGSVQAIVRQLNFAFKRNTDQQVENSIVKAIVFPSQNLYWLGYAQLGVGDERMFFVFNKQIV